MDKEGYNECEERKGGREGGNHKLIITRIFTHAHNTLVYHDVIPKTGGLMDWAGGFKLGG